MSDMQMLEAIKPKRRPISVDDMERMLASGIISRDERLELIEGELLMKPPDTRKHRATVNRLNRLFTARFNFRAVVQIQYSVVLERFSAPHPDLALLVEDATCYEGRDPQAPDILLAIEVGDTTSEFDRRVKLPLYERNGVREVWLVDVVDRVISVYRDPQGSWYGRKSTFASGDAIACEAFSDEALSVDEIILPAE